jgi:hypothetical protein
MRRKASVRLGDGDRGGRRHGCPHGIGRPDELSKNLPPGDSPPPLRRLHRAVCPALSRPHRHPEIHRSRGVGNFLEALETIKESNPLPAVCGRVCPIPVNRTAGETPWTAP